METPPPEEATLFTATGTHASSAAASAAASCPCSSSSCKPFPSFSTPVIRTDSDLSFSRDACSIEQVDSIDRISHVLTNLIREANEAVHGMERERATLIRRSGSNARSSRIPRPVSMSGRTRGRDSLVASFERLDTSMALIDSLSKDLALYNEKDHSYNLQHRQHLYILLLIPFAYMLYCLFLSLSSLDVFSTSSLVTLVALAMFLALSNLVVDHASLSTRQEDPSGWQLPGAYSLAGRDDAITATTTTNTTTNTITHALPPPPPTAYQDLHNILSSRNTQHRRRSSHHYHHHHRVSITSRRSLYRKRSSPRKLQRPIVFPTDEHQSTIPSDTYSHQNRLKRSFSF
ncbi:hypothetical protein BCR43DRAFT_489934 [Syncephalastrum racemosum]|uniref:Uncharacterized protein n=1 Tax=Syncephalastrum racemosum TaxID=13706 RepID=A0A1X2HF01_SYNRA|nr:hypothetical protein BCR43DRAFT_489934 [Syncephalastrum racemosum]